MNRLLPFGEAKEIENIEFGRDDDAALLDPDREKLPPDIMRRGTRTNDAQHHHGPVIHHRASRARRRRRQQARIELTQFAA
ncbi:hypothetical protein D3C86_1872590 [compost metagenome]